MGEQVIWKEAFSLTVFGQGAVKSAFVLKRLADPMMGDGIIGSDREVVKEQGLVIAPKSELSFS